MDEIVINVSHSTSFNIKIFNFINENKCYGILLNPFKLEWSSIQGRLHAEFSEGAIAIGHTIFSTFLLIKVWIVRILISEGAMTPSLEPPLAPSRF